MLIVCVAKVNSHPFELTMELVVVPLTKQHRNPSDMLSTTDMVPFKVLVSATNRADRFGFVRWVHDFAPTEV
jgi:hypothetical protein